MKRKRSGEGNRVYTDEIKTKIARYAAENGNTRAIRKFSEELGWMIPESTVRNFKRSYLAKVCGGVEPSVVTISSKARGRPLLLGELDGKVQEYVRHLRKEGGIITAPIVAAAAKGIVSHYNKALLPQHGGNLLITKKWAQSLMSRMGLVTKLHEKCQVTLKKSRKHSCKGSRILFIAMVYLSP